MTGKVGPKGQVVIPKQIRDRLGIRPGDRVSVDQAGDEVRITKARTASELMGSLAGGSVNPLDVLVEERSRERRREDRRFL